MLTLFKTKGRDVSPKGMTIDRVWLRNVRKELGLTLDQMAAAIWFFGGTHVAKQSVCHWEGGQTRPSPRNLHALQMLLPALLQAHKVKVFGEIVERCRKLAGLCKGMANFNRGERETRADIEAVAKVNRELENVEVLQ